MSKEPRKSVIANAVRLAHKKGYIVRDDGSVISPHGVTRKLGTKHPGKSGRLPYYRFNIVDSRSVRVPIPVHLLMAYQKFGEKTFSPGFEVRHVDGDSLNNHIENIELGTRSENELDKPKRVRVRVAKNAASKVKRLSETQEEELRTLRASGWSYQRLADYFGIAIGTAHRTLNKRFHGD